MKKLPFAMMLLAACSKAATPAAPVVPAADVAVEVAAEVTATAAAEDATAVDAADAPSAVTP